MSPDDHDQNDQSPDPDPRREGASQEGGRPPDERGKDLGPEVLRTDDPAIAAGSGFRTEWGQHPDATMVVETSGIRELVPGIVTAAVVVPYVDTAPDRDGRGEWNSPEKSQERASGTKTGGDQEKKNGRYQGQEAERRGGRESDKPKDREGQGDDGRGHGGG